MTTTARYETIDGRRILIGHEDAPPSRCDCCGRHYVGTARDDDHESWCANRAGYTDAMVEQMARDHEADEEADRANAQAELDEYKLRQQAAYSHEARVKLGYV